MNYRKFGNTGEEISALGFGCMRLPELEVNGQWSIDEEKAIPMLRRGFELGINYFDTAPYYCHSNSEIAVGKALKPIRDKVKISTKIPLDDDVFSSAADYRRLLEISLKKLDVDYVDFYHFWGISKNGFDDKILKFDLMKEAQKAKDEGLIRHISFSFHDQPESIKYIIDKGEIFETMLVQYNLLDRRNEEMAAYAQSKGLGVVAMGPVGGGRLAVPTETLKKLGQEKLASYELALKFVMGSPSINCALSGMQDIDMLEKNAALASESLTINGEEWQQIASSVEKLQKFSDLYCTGCAYCQPCPAGIKIPEIFELFTHHNVYGLSGYAKDSMANYIKNGGKTIKDCEGCGSCESRCPQHLKIRKELVRVEKILAEL